MLRRWKMMTRFSALPLASAYLSLAALTLTPTLAQQPAPDGGSEPAPPVKATGLLNSLYPGGMGLPASSPPPHKGKSSMAKPLPTPVQPLSPAVPLPSVPRQPLRAPLFLVSGSPSLQAQLSHPVLPPGLEAEFLRTVVAVPAPVAEPAPPGPALSQPEPREPQAPAFLINSADLSQIIEMLEIDPRRARMIIQFRLVHGLFRTPIDLSQVAGISDERVIEWEREGLLNFD